MDPGETLQETCARETLEETGLEVHVIKLVGIYTTPDLVIEYGGGSRVQPIAMSYEVYAVGGDLRLSYETTDFRYFSLASLDDVDVMEHHLERIRDAVANLTDTIMK